MSGSGLHGDGPPSSSQGPRLGRSSRMYQRRRAAAACQPCRARKTKCDNVRPTCGFCARSRAQCVYANESNDFTSFDPASLAILDRVNHAISLLEAQTPLQAASYLSPGGVQGLSPISVAHIQHQQQGDAGPPSVPASNQYSAQPVETEGDLFDSADFPSHIFNCEGVLQWPVLQGSIPNTQCFVLDVDETTSNNTASSNHLVSSSGPREEDFIPLSKRFLAYVHVKNPILDVGEFRSYVRDAATDGIRWDGQSCLVLIACALAHLSSPFQVDADRQSSKLQSKRDMALACYVAAKKRLGLIEPSILSLQCLFLCGVLEMYLLNPLKAWYYFNQACTMIRNQLWRKANSLGGADRTTPREIRRLEQRLYWSCMKSECELRCEIPLPPSGITGFGYPDPFPSPPTEISSPTAERSDQQDQGPHNDLEPEEERSWFYYLAEISFRRMMNRAITIFGRGGERGWIANIHENLQHYEAFEEEINIWCSHIPPQISHGGDEANPSELANYVQSRAISCREWICRPFLYYAIHQPPDDPYMPQAMVLAEKCLALCVQGYFHSQAYHRHHGTWYVARISVIRALFVLAVVRSGRIKLPEHAKELVESAVQALKFWGDEAPDLKRAGDVVERVAQESLSP